MITCEIRHDFRPVNNHYDEHGEEDTDSFSTGEWRTEEVCRECDYHLTPRRFYGWDAESREAHPRNYPFRYPYP